MATAHIAAAAGDFAPAVLMPTDPKQSTWLAEQLLTDAKLVTDSYGLLGYTGTHQGKPLSIMTSGLGLPSLVLIATELVRSYNVDRIVRIGPSGAIARQLTLGDVIIATGAHTNSYVNEARLPGGHFSAVADFKLAAAAMAAAGDDPNVTVGVVVSNDNPNYQVPSQSGALLKHNVLVAEQETAGLYGVADEYGKQALALLTVTEIYARNNAFISAEEAETANLKAANLAVAALFS
ncbi:MAG: purine-nucleoside phosphorylase [Propionibacteriaceae bacterium]|jgi:purine-nucleoside phosphorylase|nr:purine-nucleoside phosphorylase [Propionibacteriaceae bacterium]